MSRTVGPDLISLGLQMSCWSAGCSNPRIQRLSVLLRIAWKLRSVAAGLMVGQTCFWSGEMMREIGWPPGQWRNYRMPSCQHCSRFLLWSAYPNSKWIILRSLWLNLAGKKPWPIKSRRECTVSSLSRKQSCRWPWCHFSMTGRSETNRTPEQKKFQGQSFLVLGFRNSARLCYKNTGARGWARLSDT